MNPVTDVSSSSSIQSMTFYSPSHHFLCCEDPYSNPLTYTSPPSFCPVQCISIKLYLDDAIGPDSTFSESFSFPLEHFLGDPAYAYSMFADVWWPYEEVEIAVSGILDFVQRFVNQPSNIDNWITPIVVHGSVVTPISGDDRKVNWKLEKFKVKDSEFTEDKCAICLEKLSGGATAAKLSCGHIYDDECIMQWLKKSNTCPVCRLEVPVQEETELNT